MNPPERKLRPFLEWAAGRPPRSAWSWGLHPEKIAAHAIMLVSLKLFGILSALAAECVYLALRMLLLPRLARAVLRRWDLDAYATGRGRQSVRPPEVTPARAPLSGPRG